MHIRLACLRVDFDKGVGIRAVPTQTKHEYSSGSRIDDLGRTVFRFWMVDVPAVFSRRPSDPEESQQHGKQSEFEESIERHSILGLPLRPAPLGIQGRLSFVLRFAPHDFIVRNAENFAHQNVEPRRRLWAFGFFGWRFHLLSS
jgi:hypothetical protein